MSWLDVVLNTAAPMLPAPVTARLYLGLAWGLVLACGGLWLMRRLVGGRTAWSLALVLFLWSCWPGAASPSYWLGLAFRAPSLTSAALCAVWLWWQWRGAPKQAADPASLYAPVLGVALGWLLLLDTFAAWPVALYPLGFSPALLGLVVLAAGWPWLRTGGPATGWALGAGAVLLLFVLLRLPSGNLWDALLDPWLWAGLHAVLARRLWLRWRRAPAATRA